MKKDEHYEQVALVKWLQIKGLRYNATPNGGYRNITTATMLKQEGVSAGYPDINVYLTNKMLCIEMKKKGGKIQPNQKEWIEYLNTLPYCKSKVCYGAIDAIDFIVGEM